MSEALDAKQEIQDALSEYGSDVVYKRITKGEYDPETGENGSTVISTNLKALVSRNATNRTNDAFQSISELENIIGAYERVFVISPDFEPTKYDKIVFKNVEHTILYIAPSTLQNVNFKYEILVKR